MLNIRSVGMIYFTKTTATFSARPHWCKLLSCLETLSRNYTATVKSRMYGTLSGTVTATTLRQVSSSSSLSAAPSHATTFTGVINEGYSVKKKAHRTNAPMQRHFGKDI